MSISALLPGILSGAQNALNWWQTDETNSDQRNFTLQMYQRQRADAIADRDYQNTYNSPAAQMDRLKAAGLNPNLVYGTGAATEAAAPTRGSDAGSYHPTAPQLDLSSMMSIFAGFQDVAVKQAQTDNLKAQHDLIQAETVAKNIGSEWTSWLTERSKELYPVDLSNAVAQFNKTLADTKVTLDANERAAAMQAPNLEAAVENVLNLRASRANTQARTDETRAAIQNLQRSGVLQDLEIALKKRGITWGDPLYLRMLGQIVNDPEKVVEEAKRVLQGFGLGKVQSDARPPGYPQQPVQDSVIDEMGRKKYIW